MNIDETKTSDKKEESVATSTDNNSSAIEQKTEDKNDDFKRNNENRPDFKQKNRKYRERFQDNRSSSDPVDSIDYIKNKLKRLHSQFDDYTNDDVRQLKRLEKIDDGFKDEEAEVLNRRAGSPLCTLGGGDAFYFSEEDPKPPFEDVVALQFQPSGKIYWYHYPVNAESTFKIEAGDKIIAYSERGVELADSLNKSRELYEKQSNTVFIKNGIIRKATEEDFIKQKELELKAKEARAHCERFNAELGIKMKIIKVKYTLDDTKVIFYFTANGRVDFRELIKKLAYVVRRRIEMRQIGVRDTTKMMGGLGPCGMPLCCRRFLHSFSPVSIKNAKDQNLSLNPTKISGICSRLFCCLAYENDFYEEERLKYPPEDSEVIELTTKRKGIVKKINVITGDVTVLLIENGHGNKIEEKTFPLSDFRKKDKEDLYEITLEAEKKREAMLKDVSPVVPVEKKALNPKENTSQKRKNNQKNNVKRLITENENADNIDDDDEQES